MKSIIIYNTRSGNTKELAEKMGGVLEKYGHEHEIARDKDIKNKVEIVEKFDLLCVGSPTHIGRAAFFPFRKVTHPDLKFPLGHRKFRP